ncbi:MAG: hypothetical protein ACLSUW_06745 [Akkermansia sp.]
MIARAKPLGSGFLHHAGIVNVIHDEEETGAAVRLPLSLILSKLGTGSVTH